MNISFMYCTMAYLLLLAPIFKLFFKFCTLHFKIKLNILFFISFCEKRKQTFLNLGTCCEVMTALVMNLSLYITNIIFATKSYQLVFDSSFPNISLLMAQKSMTLFTETIFVMHALNIVHNYLSVVMKSGLFENIFLEMVTCLSFKIIKKIPIFLLSGLKVILRVKILFYYLREQVHCMFLQHA